MTISPGEKIPSVNLKVLGENGIDNLDIADYIKGKNVVIFGVPAAYTPVCTMNHMPGFVNNADEIKSKGIDEIICIHVNDPFVSQQWAKDCDCESKVTVIPDGNAELTKALGLELDGSGFGLGTRCQRFSMIVEDGVVQSLDIEDEATTLDKSSAETCLVNLQQKAA